MEEAYLLLFDCLLASELNTKVELNSFFLTPGSPNNGLALLSKVPYHEVCHEVCHGSCVLHPNTPSTSPQPSPIY